MGETRPDDAAEAGQAARRGGGLPARLHAGETIFRPGDSARGWIGIIPLATGAVGMRPLYTALGMSTCATPKKA
jgi:hypothetical protein